MAHWLVGNPCLAAMCQSGTRPISQSCERECAIFARARMWALWSRLCGLACRLLYGGQSANVRRNTTCRESGRKAKMTAKEFNKDVIVPLAQDARCWKQAQHNAMVEEVIASLEKDDLDAKSATTLLQAAGNISAFRQKLEDEEVIPKSTKARGKSALGALFAD